MYAVESTSGPIKAAYRSQMGMKPLIYSFIVVTCVPVISHDWTLMRFTLSFGGYSIVQGASHMPDWQLFDGGSGPLASSETPA